jgi:hypothetical protein
MGTPSVACGHQLKHIVAEFCKKILIAKIFAFNFFPVAISLVQLQKVST